MRTSFLGLHRERVLRGCGRTIEYWRCEILFAHSSAYISILSLSTPPYTIYTYNIYLFLVSLIILLSWRLTFYICLR